MAALAHPDEVLVTDDLLVAAGARSLRRHGIRVEELGERALRNVLRPVVLHRAALAQHAARARDTGARASRPTAHVPWGIGGTRELANA